MKLCNNFSNFAISMLGWNGCMSSSSVCGSASFEGLSRRLGLEDVAELSYLVPTGKLAVNIDFEGLLFCTTIWFLAMKPVKIGSCGRLLILYLSVSWIMALYNIQCIAFSVYTLEPRFFLLDVDLSLFVSGILMLKQCMKNPPTLPFKTSH